MLLDAIHLAAAASWLPPARPVAAAVAAGECDADEAARNAYDAICVGGTAAATDLAAADMAVAAGRTAMARSGVARPDVAAVLHASMWFTGLEFWPAASYVHARILGRDGRRAIATDVAQMSNGGLAAVELAAAVLAAAPAREAVLVTTGDHFGGAGFDRWRSDVAGIVYGDGGAAAVLARNGFARLRSIGSVTDSRLEGLYRGAEPLGVDPGRGVDVRSRRAAFRAEHDRDDVTGWIRDGLVEAVTGGLDENGASVDDVAAWVFPAIGRHGVQVGYLDPLGVALERTNWPTARRTGHVGAGDQLIGLEALILERRVRPGDLVALVGIGAGFTWTLAVVEIGEVPDWAVQE